MLVDAYQRGRLIAILPFMTKLLECCKGSKIFTPSNPMIAGILSLLAELHGMKVGWRRGCAEQLAAGCAVLPSSEATPPPVTDISWRCQVA